MILYILVMAISVLIGMGVATLFWAQIVKYANCERKKMDNYYHLFDQWMSNYENNQTSELFFKENGYKNIAIYGMKELGRHLLKELEQTDICVKYIIDRNLSMIPPEFTGYLPDDKLPEVDVIVITASYYYSEIREKLNHWGYDIVSIDDVVGGKYIK